ncbi:major capsid pentamer protein [Mycobacterium phage Faze9]|uniref:Uncharacterized protein n=1 Tax=Mycobacterium phage Faze9 TaxID=2488786 RepID=A0A3G8FFS8_9CAUD|nr:major capsid pentamer protein [Mycobacterium phage Faze9]
MALGTLTTESSALPVQFDAPLVNPSPQGLYGATQWSEDAGPSRFLISGVDVLAHNYGGALSTGLWGAPWCVAPDDLTENDIKTGTRPQNLDTFVAMVPWGFDECALTAPSRDEVRLRATQNLRLREQVMVEREFADRLLDDVGTPDEVDGLIGAVAALEADLAVTGTLGLIHASAQLAAAATHLGLVLRSGNKLTTPLGHQWVFGGGYVDGLANTLVATSPTFGWRDAVATREALDHTHNRFVAIAERALVIGYEAAIGAASIVDPEPTEEP